VEGAALQGGDAFVGQLGAAVHQTGFFGTVFERLARDGVVVGLVGLAQVGGIGVGHGAFLAHPQQGGRGVQAAREGDADLLAGGKRLQDGVGHGLGRRAGARAAAAEVGKSAIVPPFWRAPPVAPAGGPVRCGQIGLWRTTSERWQLRFQ